ncbi:MAG: DNA-directed RNA polymerase subunit RpoH/Rpb5 C-terminal domain-containing protein [Candidatus Micrarchaeota archaeon]
MKKKPTAPTVDVLSHKLVPEMKILGESEKSKVLSKFGVNLKQLPRMTSKDPAALALKATPGDLVKVERDDGTGKYTTYRVVIE